MPMSKKQTHFLDENQTFQMEIYQEEAHSSVDYDALNWSHHVTHTEKNEFLKSPAINAIFYVPRNVAECPIR